MMVRTSSVFAGAARSLLVAGLLAGGALAQQDRVVLKDGKERVVKILGEEYDGIKISVEGSGSSSIPWKSVDSIRYANAGKYQEALAAFNAAKFAEALPLFEALAADEKLRPVLRHVVLYHLGLAQQRLGDADRAIATYEDLLEAFPRSRYLLSVGTNVLSLYVAKGDASGAARLLESSLASVRSAGGDAGSRASVDYLRGRILEEQSKLGDAERIYQGIAGAADADTDVVAAAKLGIARCAQRGNRAADAERLYREIVALKASNEVLAGAWNGLGDLAIGDALAKRDPDGLRSALFAYLRGVVLYVPGSEDPSEEYERALAGASKAFRAIGELEADAARKKLFLDRAKQRSEQLAAQYPRSRYLKGL